VSVRYDRMVWVGSVGLHTGDRLCLTAGGGGAEHAVDGDITY